MDQEIRVELDMLKRLANNNQTVIMQLGNDFMQLNLNATNTIDVAKETLKNIDPLTRRLGEVLPMIVQNQQLMLKEIEELKEKVSLATLPKEK